MNQALSFGLTYIMNVQGCPTWANGGDSQKRLLPTDDHTADFQAFVAALVAFFRGRVTHYEFINEPNGQNSWRTYLPNNNRQNGANYAPWLQRFAQGIKAGDPNAWVATGGVDNLVAGHGLDFVQGIYDGGGQPYFDAVAGHPYN